MSLDYRYNMEVRHLLICDLLQKHCPLLLNGLLSGRIEWSDKPPTNALSTVTDEVTLPQSSRSQLTKAVRDNLAICCNTSMRNSINVCNPQNSSDDSFGSVTLNNFYQCSQLQAVQVRMSKKHGWGAFAAKQFRRGDFIIEYVGELISDIEADRRGKAYDYSNSSFLFHLNDKLVVDAKRKGGLAKFINHMAETRANCTCKIICVNGGHRVGIFAKLDIEIGQELFFDYGYTAEAAPRWCTKQK